MSDTTLNRREFLAGTATLAAAAATQARAAADAEPVRVALVGTGGRGCDLLRHLSTIEQAKIVAVCDDYEPHLKEGVKYAGGAPGPGPGAPGAVVQAFSDFRTMLEKVKPQAVVIATPLSQHFPMCVAAIESGAAVFCEKTMCHAIDEAVKLRKLVEEKKAIFQVGLQRRANPIYHQALAMAQTGIIGKITAIKAQWHRNNNWRRPVPVPRSHADWQALEHRLNWRLYWPYSQGLMTELGSHQMDVANWFLGELTPTRVMATGGIDYWRDGREVFDNLFCVYEYEVAPKQRRTGLQPVTNKSELTERKAAEHSANAPKKADRPTLPQPLPKREGSQGPQAADGRDEDVAKPVDKEANAYTVRVTYSSMQSNAYEGASELIMGDKGTILLTETKGLLWREPNADLIGWSARDKDKNASIITSGKTLGMANDPWAHRGKPFEIDSDTNATRQELLSFIEKVQAGDRATICDVHVGTRNTATALIANEAITKGSVVAYPADAR